MNWEEEIIFVLQAINTKSEKIKDLEPLTPLSPSRAIKAIYGMYYNDLWELMKEKKILDDMKLLFFLEDTNLIKHVENGTDRSENYYQITENGMSFLMLHENNQYMKNSIKWLIISIGVAIWACLTSVILQQFSCIRIGVEVLISLIIMWISLYVYQGFRKVS